MDEEAVRVGCGSGGVGRNGMRPGMGGRVMRGRSSFFGGGKRN